MTISAQIKRITWILVVFLVSTLVIQQFTYVRINQLLEDEAQADDIVVKITSFLLFQKEIEDRQISFPIENWKKNFREVQELAQSHSKLNSEIKPHLEVLNRNVDELASMANGLNQNNETLSYQLLFERNNTAARNILSDAEEFSKRLSTRIKKSILITNLTQGLFILILLFPAGLFLSRFLRSTSKSLNNLLAQISEFEFEFSENDQSNILDKQSLSYTELQDIAHSFNSLISQLENASKSIYLNKEFLEGIFNAANVGLCQVDESARFVRVNDEYCRIYGYSREELIGEKITKILPQEVHEMALETYHKMLSNPAENKEHPTEWQVINKDGEVFDILTTTSIVENNSEKYQIASVLDISAYKDDQNKLTIALESGKIGTWFLDLRTGEMSVNKYWAEMLGLQKNEVENEQEFFMSLIHPDDFSKIYETIEQVKDPTANSFSFNIRMRTKEGAYKWILDSGMVTRRGAGGEPLVMAGTHIDLSEEIEWRSRIEEERDRLVESQKIGQLGDWTYDLAAGKITSSEEVYNIFEWDKNLAPPSFEDLLKYNTEEGASLLKESVERAINSGQPYDIKHTIKLNGKEKHIRSIGEPILDDNGKVVSLKGVTQDITEQVNIERQKELTENRLNAIADNIPGAIFQYRLEENGSDQMLYVSQGAKELWGYSPEKIMENNMLVWEQFHADDLAEVQQSIEKSALNLSTWKAEWRNINKDKSISWLQGRGTPRMINTAIVWDSIILDITNQKETSLQLQEREAYLRSLYYNAFDGILSCDEKGNLIYFNQVLKSWVGRPEDKFNPEDYPSVFGLYTFDQNRLLRREELSLVKALQHGTVQFNRFVIKNEKNPKPRYVEANGSRITDESGKVLGAVVIIRDITKSIKADSEVSTAVINAVDEERTKVASELHDNITQTLGMGKMNLGNLAVDYPELEKNSNFQTVMKMLSMAIEDTRKLSHQIMPTSILDFGLIPAIEELLEGIERSSQLEVHFTYNKNKRVRRDIEVNLFRVAQEGLSNVQRHSKADNLWVNVDIYDDHLKMIIKDDGIGINQEYAQHQKVKGIGMITMRNRIEHLNGNLIIDSSKRGTELKIELSL